MTHTVGSVMSFTDVASATPDDPNRTALRVDPFYGALWGSGASATWSSRETVIRHERMGLDTLPYRLRQDPAAAIERIVGSGGVHQRKRLAALSAIHLFKTTTGGQLASATGHHELGEARIPHVLADLFAAGLIDIGLYTGLTGTRAASQGHLYRPSRTDVFERVLRPRMTWAEVISTTAGLRFETGAQHDRHAVLATELALRVAEFCEIAAVLGERLSTLQLLAHEGAGFPQRRDVHAAADATLVRTDGVRLAVEITASASPQLEKKIRAWAQLLDYRRFADTGLAVIFVVADRPEGDIRSGLTMNRLRKMVAGAARDFPGVDFDRVASRMFVASWRDWFPNPNEVSRSFLTLDAQRPTGPTVDTRWEPASALDVFDLPFSPNPRRPEWDPFAVIRNTASLLGQPHWLRDSTSSKPVWPEPIKAMGFTSLPIAPPTRPETFRHGVVGAAVGRAGNAQPPRRLRLGG